MAVKKRSKLQPTRPHSLADRLGVDPQPKLPPVPAAQDSPLRLLRMVKDGLVPPRTLSPEQRRSLVAVLACGSMRGVQIAAFLQVSQSTYEEDLRAVRRKLGEELRTWTAADVAGYLAGYAERCAAQAMEMGDAGLAWTVARDFARSLRELGLAGQGEDKAGLRITVETLGQGYERARLSLSNLDPAVTGEVVEASARVLPGLPLRPRRPDAPSGPEELRVRGGEGFASTQNRASPEGAEGEPSEEPSADLQDEPDDLEDPGA